MHFSVPILKNPTYVSKISFREQSFSFKKTVSIPCLQQFWSFVPGSRLHCVLFPTFPPNHQKTRRIVKRFCFSMSHVHIKPRMPVKRTVSRVRNIAIARPFRTDRVARLNRLTPHVYTNVGPLALFRRTVRLNNASSPTFFVSHLFLEPYTVFVWVTSVNRVENSGIWSKIDGSSSEQVRANSTVSYAGPMPWGNQSLKLSPS
jgi:hypothetical protein